jgi:AcrR family transcriptional regulator
MTGEEREAKQQIILAALAKAASIKHACELADVPRRTFYNWQKNKIFAAALKEAHDEGNDTIDDAIIERAIQGVREPLVSMGKLVYDEHPAMDGEGNPKLDKRGNPIMERGAQIFVNKPSDRMLELAAKSRMKKYRDRVDLDLLEQINENTGGAISLNTKDLTIDELAQIRQIGLNMKAREEKR